MWFLLLWITVTALLKMRSDAFISGIDTFLDNILKCQYFWTCQYNRVHSVQGSQLQRITDSYVSYKGGTVQKKIDNPLQSNTGWASEKLEGRGKLTPPLVPSTHACWILFYTLYWATSFYLFLVKSGNCLEFKSHEASYSYEKHWWLSGSLLISRTSVWWWRSPKAMLNYHSLIELLGRESDMAFQLNLWEESGNWGLLAGHPKYFGLSAWMSPNSSDHCKPCLKHR